MSKLRHAALCLALAAGAACTEQTPPPAPGPLADNVNPFVPADAGDTLDAALIRLARTAMAADLAQYESWLFDRATVYYKLSRWSGDAEFRNYAFELVQRYYDNIDDAGSFKLKPRDSKYSYVDGAVWYERETGDLRFRSKARAIYKMWLREMPSTYSPSARMWTEREIAYAFGAAVGWYELSGEEGALSRARDLLKQWATMSEGSGAPLHTLAQHQEEFQAPWGPRRMTSPWMAALFFEYVQVYHRLTGDRQALQIVSDYADFLLKHGLYDGSLDHPNLRGRLMPYYLCGVDGVYERETPSEADGEHTPDVMGLMAFAVYAKRELGVDAAPSLEAYRALRESAAMFVDRRRDVDPPRKISWWFGTSYDSAWLTR